MATTATIAADPDATPRAGAAGHERHGSGRAGQAHVEPRSGAGVVGAVVRGGSEGAVEAPSD